MLQKDTFRICATLQQENVGLLADSLASLKG